MSIQKQQESCGCSNIFAAAAATAPSASAAAAAGCGNIDIDIDIDIAIDWGCGCGCGILACIESWKFDTPILNAAGQTNWVEASAVKSGVRWGAVDGLFGGTAR